MELVPGKTYGLMKEGKIVDGWHFTLNSILGSEEKSFGYFDVITYYVRIDYKTPDKKLIKNLNAIITYNKKYDVYSLYHSSEYDTIKIPIVRISKTPIYKPLKININRKKDMLEELKWLPAGQKNNIPSVSDLNRKNTMIEEFKQMRMAPENQLVQTHDVHLRKPLGYIPSSFPGGIVYQEMKEQFNQHRSSLNEMNVSSSKTRKRNRKMRKVSRRAKKNYT